MTILHSMRENSSLCKVEGRENEEDGLKPETLKKSGKSLDKVSRVWKRSRKTFSRFLLDSLGAGGLGDSFQTFSGFRARRARETSKHDILFYGLGRETQLQP